MLNDQQILADIHALPQDKQAEVLDFIAFVKSRPRMPAQVPSPKAAELLQLMKKASEQQVFQTIQDPLDWQAQLRNEWD
ncbi:MAG: hypothetical protein IV090_26315 [Candidatus Sericytochromatia bacterium]|nr:hypothetical protein [Candidatus Sericytochromatia bacterium]